MSPQTYEISIVTFEMLVEKADMAQACDLVSTDTEKFSSGMNREWKIGGSPRLGLGSKLSQEPICTNLLLYFDIRERRFWSSVEILQWNFLNYSKNVLTGNPRSQYYSNLQINNSKGSTRMTQVHPNQ